MAESGPFRVSPGAPKAENGSPSGPEKGPKADPKTGIRDPNLEIVSRNSNTKLELELHIRGRGRTLTPALTPSLAELPLHSTQVYQLHFDPG